MTDQEMKALIERLCTATAERDGYSEEGAAHPELGPPATDAQCAALARHWGRELPPSYRQFLQLHNGMTRFWFDIPLLSTEDIIGDTAGMSTFEEPFPALWRTIIACGADSYDALALDPADPSADGELAVVLVGDEGEDERWPTFEAFLVAHVAKVEAEAESERADRQGLQD